MHAWLMHFFCINATSCPYSLSPGLIFFYTIARDNEATVTSGFAINTTTNKIKS